MKITKNFKGLVQEDFRYVFNGDIVTTESLEIDLDMGLFVTGSIKAGEYIEAGGYIKAGGYIEAGWSIEAGESIEAGWFIEAGESIEAGWFIEAGEFIKAGEYIEAGWFIEAGEFIKAGGSYGITAGLSITCKGKLGCGLNLFAGVCSWREISEEEKTITCGKLESGTIEYGILRETGVEESDDKTQEAMRLLKEQGYKIIRQ